MKLGRIVIKAIIITITNFICEPSFFLKASSINLIIVIIPTKMLVDGINNIKNKFKGLVFGSYKKFVIKAEAIISSIINIDITLKYIKP